MNSWIEQDTCSVGIEDDDGDIIFVHLDDVPQLVGALRTIYEKHEIECE